MAENDSLDRIVRPVYGKVLNGLVLEDRWVSFGQSAQSCALSLCTVEAVLIIRCEIGIIEVASNSRENLNV
jgi:hypothetical protein